MAQIPQYVQANYQPYLQSLGQHIHDTLSSASKRIAEKYQNKVNYQDIQNVYKLLQNNISVYGENVISPEEASNYKRRLTSPDTAEMFKSNPAAYLEVIGNEYGNILKEIKQKKETTQQSQRQADVLSAGQSIYGTPAVPEQPQGIAGRGATQYTGMGEDVWTEEGTQEPPAIAGRAAAPPAQTRGEGYQRVVQTMQEQGQTPATIEEYEKLTGGKYLPLKETQEPQMTPYQKWQTQHQEKKYNADQEMKKIAQQFKQKGADEKESKKLLEYAMRKKEEQYEPLLYDATKEIDRLKEELKSKKQNLLNPLTRTEEESIKLNIKKNEELVKKYNKILLSSDPNDIFEFLPPGSYDFKEGSYNIKRTGAGKQTSQPGGSTQESMIFDTDVLAAGAKLRAKNIPEEKIQAFMMQLQQQKQGQ